MRYRLTDSAAPVSMLLVWLDLEVAVGEVTSASITVDAIEIDYMERRIPNTHLASPKYGRGTGITREDDLSEPVWSPVCTLSVTRFTGELFESRANEMPCTLGVRLCASKILLDVTFRGPVNQAGGHDILRDRTIVAVLFDSSQVGANL